MKTKTSWSLLVLFFSFTSFLQAQKGWNMEFSIEPHGSTGGDFKVPVDVFNTNSVFVSLEKEFRMGIDAGVDAGYFITDKAGLSFGVHYASVGVDYRDYVWSYSGTVATMSKNISLDYIKVPVLFHYVSSPEQKTSFTLQAGFYFGYLLGYRDENRAVGSNGATVSLIAENRNIINTITDNNGSYTETAVFTTEPFYTEDFGGIIGLGLQFQLSETVFLPLMLNYEVGFGNVKNKSSTYSAGGDTYLYWDDGMGNRPNLTLDYSNASVGIKIGVKVVFTEKK